MSRSTAQFIVCKAAAQFADSSFSHYSKAFAAQHFYNVPVLPTRPSSALSTGQILYLAAPTGIKIGPFPGLAIPYTYECRPAKIFCTVATQSN